MSIRSDFHLLLYKIRESASGCCRSLLDLLGIPTMHIVEKVRKRDGAKSQKKIKVESA
jgi:hypothetical protein